MLAFAQLPDLRDASYNTVPTLDWDSDCPRLLVPNYRVTRGDTLLIPMSRDKLYGGCKPVLPATHKL